MVVFVGSLDVGDVHVAAASDEEQRRTLMMGEMWRQSVAPFSLGHNNIFRRVPGKWPWLFFQLPTNQLQ